MNHVDVDQLLEDYAWSHFKDIQSLRKTRLDEFKSLDRDECEFIIVNIHLFKYIILVQIMLLPAIAGRFRVYLFGSMSVEIGPISDENIDN
ncbi:hypothetical protein NECAME_12531 [Necator americanus]|uniref:Uncharacterized protein n=1 Tax=Necator americanus TaxID=51031 RepID=W2T1B6_NECAM|nr:hypothetical protein NECAME_12531 [Necator americanus]ETN75046.1 hypothetical protein NECAME_12531 [Necator americanus]